jgi:hypothetical protein
MTEIAQVRTDHHASLGTRDQDDRCIDDVGRFGPPAENAGCFGEHSIEWWDFGCRFGEEGTQHHLPSAVSPNLSEHARWHDQSGAASQGLAKERAHARIRALEGDQRARV